MNILIIGSKGFIGSHCVKFFSKRHTVWECDVVTDYVSNNYFIVDATNADYSDIFQHQKFDICINCSGASSVPDSIKNPVRDFNLNVLNVHKQLDSIRKHNINCKYINLSSAAVYGNPVTLPIKETDETKPISPYGFHKRMAEYICEEFHANYNLATCSLRIFSSYGPGLQKQLFWDLYKKALSKNEILLFGTGNESRDFIYISDLMEALNCIISVSEFKADIINVASGNELYIKDVVDIFYKLIDKTDYKFGGEERQGDPLNWKADITKLSSYGFRPKIGINKGLNEYFIWLSANV